MINKGERLKAIDIRENSSRVKINSSSNPMAYKSSLKLDIIARGNNKNNLLHEINDLKELILLGKFSFYMYIAKIIVIVSSLAFTGFLSRMLSPTIINTAIISILLLTIGFTTSTLGNNLESDSYKNMEYYKIRLKAIENIIEDSQEN